MPPLPLVTMPVPLRSRASGERYEGIEVPHRPALPVSCTVPAVRPGARPTEEALKARPALSEGSVPCRYVADKFSAVRLWNAVNTAEGRVPPMLVPAMLRDFKPSALVRLYRSAGSFPEMPGLPERSKLVREDSPSPPTMVVQAVEQYVDPRGMVPAAPKSLRLRPETALGNASPAHVTPFLRGEKGEEGMHVNAPPSPPSPPSSSRGVPSAVSLPRGDLARVAISKPAGGGVDEGRPGERGPQ